MTENFHHMTSKFPLLWISSNTDINIHVRAEWFMTHRESHTCWKYLSQLMYSLSWESCSLLVLMYCQRAWMMQERVWVWMPSRRARRGSSLNWGGCGSNVIDLQHFFTTAHSRAHQTVLYFPRLENGCHVRQQSLTVNDVSIECRLAEMVKVCGTCPPHPDSHLVVQHQQQSAAHAHVSWPFHLEAVCLLGGGCAMPLKQQNQHTLTTQSHKGSHYMLFSHEWWDPAIIPLLGKIWNVWIMMKRGSFLFL